MITYDFSQLIKRNSKGHIDWEKSVGKIIRFKSLHKNGELQILDTTRYKTNTKILVKYENNKKWIFTSELKPKNYCEFLDVCDDTSSMKRIKVYKYNIGENIVSDKYDFNVLDRFVETKKISRKNLDGTNRVNNSYKYLLKCNRCGYDKLIRKEHEVCRVCPVCCSSPQIVVQGINDIPTTNPELIKFFPDGYKQASQYTKASNKKINPRCPDCGKVSKKKYQINQIQRMNNIPCECNGVGSSYWERYVFELLNQLSLNFNHGARFDWCKFYNPYKNKYTYGIYDFVITDCKIIIETDGSFHRENNQMSNQTVEESIFLDEIKDKLAYENGYCVIRLSCDGDGWGKHSSEIIKREILKSILPFKLNFDAKDIDWIQCDLYASSNSIVEACELYKRGEKDLKKIGQLIGMSESTVLNYLYKGTKLGLCNYDSKAYRSEKYLEWAKTRRKKITVYDSIMNKVGVFNDREELEEKSEEIFGVKFLYGGVTKSCCTGKMYKKHYFKADYT